MKLMKINICSVFDHYMTLCVLFKVSKHCSSIRIRIMHYAL